MRTVWVSSRAIAWNVAVHAPCNGRIEGPGLGFLPIYGTEREAEDAHPGATAFPILIPESWIQAARPQHQPAVDA